MAFWCYTLLCSVIAALVATPGVFTQDSTPEPSFSVTPSDTTAARGHSITLYCTVANRGRHQVFWNVDQRSAENTAGKEFTLGPNTNVHNSYPRFQFVGDTGEGEFNLQITNVTAEDAGAYTCLVNDPLDTASTAMEAGARLTVVDTVVAPMGNFPLCTLAPVQEMYEEGTTLTLTCSSRGGVPLPSLSWMRIKDGIAQNLPSTTTVRGDVVTTTARMDLSSVDHLSFYRCIETHPSSASERECTGPPSQTGPQATLNVRFKPVVTITPNVVNVQTLETIAVELDCGAYGNPPLTSGPSIILPENKTGEPIDRGLNSRTAVVVEMTTDDVGKDFYCRATNDLGVGEDVVDVRRLGALPTWMILVIIAVSAIVIFIFIVIVSCILCVDRSGSEDDKRKDPNRLRYSVNKSRPTSLRHEGEDDFIDGYQDEMVPIEDFQGGQESAAMHVNKGVTNDFETGETGPRYQNVNEAFQRDSVHSNSLSQSSPSSNEPIIDPNSE